MFSSLRSDSNQTRSSSLFLGFKQFHGWLLLLFAFFMMVGTYARFSGLGRWPLATDEFYMMQSVDFWSKSGLPTFPAGGYYNRGLLVQAVLLLTSSLLGENELSARLPIAVIGLLSILILFLLARRRAGPTAAVLIAGTALLSSWHVEFARFSRMYAPLFMVTLLFSYAVLRGWLNHHPGWRIAALLLATLSAFVHEAQVILAAQLFFVLMIPAYRRRTGRPWMWLGLAGLAVLFGIVWDQIPSFPPSVETLSAIPAPGPIHLPIWRAHQLLLGHPVATGLYVLFIILGLVTALRARMPAAGMLVAIVLASLQIGLAVSLLFLLVCWGALPRGLADTSLRRGLALLFFGAVFMVMFSAVLAGERSVFMVTIDYPYLYQTVIYPWLQVEPLLTVLCFLAAGLAAARIIWHGVRPQRDLTAILVCTGLLSIATIRAIRISTRYSYMFYSLMMLLVTEVTIRILRALRLRFRLRLPIWRRGLAAGLVFVAFLISDDFHPCHLAHPASRESNFRLGPFKKYSAHWYQRYDFRGLAAKAQLLLGKDGMLFLDRRTLPVAWYFPPAQTRVFIPRGDFMASLVLPDGHGKWREMWTNLPLSFGFQELATDLGQSPRVLYAAHVVDRDWPRLKAPDSPVGRAWRFERVFTDLSGSLGLYRVLPAEASP